MNFPTFCWICWDPIILEMWTIFPSEGSFADPGAYQRLSGGAFWRWCLKILRKIWNILYFWEKLYTHYMHYMYCYQAPFQGAKILVMKLTMLKSWFYVSPEIWLWIIPVNLGKSRGGGSLWKNHLRWNDNAGAWELLQLPLRPVGARGCFEGWRDGDVSGFWKCLFR